MLDRLDETIVAISSAPGRSAVGIVRLSGAGAIGIGRRLFTAESGRALSELPGFSRVGGRVELGEGLAVPAIVHVFRGPRSYTREDLVEIQTIGSPPLLGIVVERAQTLGARAAEPGEFTARAFFNGAMSLDEAEAVGGLIAAQSDAQLRAARRLREGVLSGQITAARDRLAELLALVEADIDFAEEPIEFIRPGEAAERLRELAGELERLTAEAVTSERLEELPSILLLGAPNAGKSTLMNRLSGTTRAICAAVAGTTRDLLSAPIRVGRGEAMLLDAAGLDATAEEVIAAARRLTLAAAGRVDLICVVADATAEVPPAVLEAVGLMDRERVVLAANKADLLADDARGGVVARFEGLGLGSVELVSALRGDGVEALRHRFEEMLAGAVTTVESHAVVLNERQRQCIAEALVAIERAAEVCDGSAETIDCADVLAFELREALDQLGAVTGAVGVEELLGQVFARFCIGK